MERPYRQPSGWPFGRSQDCKGWSPCTNFVHWVSSWCKNQPALLPSREIPLLPLPTWGSNGGRYLPLRESWLSPEAALLEQPHGWLFGFFFSSLSSSTSPFIFSVYLSLSQLSLWGYRRQLMMNSTYVFFGLWVQRLIYVLICLFGFIIQKNYIESGTICSICFSVVVVDSMVLHAMWIFAFQKY